MARFTIDGSRYDTSKMHAVWEGREKTGTGMYREGVYLTKTSKRVFVKTDSRWQRPGGQEAVGEQWHQADMDEIAWLARYLDDDALYALVPDDSE